MGFWSDLTQWGQEQVQQEAQRRLNQGGQSAHISAQNEAVADFQQILSSYHAGILTNAAAQQQIQTTAAGFKRLAENLGYPRALAGSLEVTTLASRLAADLRAELTGSGVLAAGLPAVSPTVLIGAAVVAYLLLKKAR